MEKFLSAHLISFPFKNPLLLEMLHGNSILLGLNISRRIERPLGNFYDPSPMAKAAARVYQ